MLSEGVDGGELVLGISRVDVADGSRVGSAALGVALVTGNSRVDVAVGGFVGTAGAGEHPQAKARETKKMKCVLWMVGMRIDYLYQVVLTAFVRSTFPF
jgi:hypothetical protein